VIRRRRVHNARAASALEWCSAWWNDMNGKHVGDGEFEQNSKSDADRVGISQFRRVQCHRSASGARTLRGAKRPAKPK
jgi:hypothetical protein